MSARPPGFTTAREDRALAAVARAIESMSGGCKIYNAILLPEWPRIRARVLRAMRDRGRQRGRKDR